jgi:ribonuclease P protein component
LLTKAPTLTSAEDACFGKDRRVRKRKEYRLVYDTGRKQTRRCFAAFCLQRGDAEATRVGFTTPRALGKANQRNRIRRRLREAVRLSYHRLPVGWSLVFNPRRVVTEVSFSELLAEVEEVLDRCAASF